MPRFPMSICLLLALIMLHLAPLAMVKCKSSAQMSLTPVRYQSTQVSWSLDYILQQGSSSRQRISPHFQLLDCWLFQSLCFLIFNSSYHHIMYTYNLYKSWWNWASAFTEDCICWILYLHLVDLCSSQIVVTVRKWMLLLKFLYSTKLPQSVLHECCAAYKTNLFESLLSYLNQIHPVKSVFSYVGLLTA